MYRLYVLEQVRKDREDVANGRVISAEGFENKKLNHGELVLGCQTAAKEILYIAKDSEKAFMGFSALNKYFAWRP